ncbi:MULTISPECIES: leucyl aminopeptidase [Gemella]|uniref:leucyl aminopeptidase n=1 Tax=Gemella TaxID=1378 RepID=UPI0007681723|nr:MULTISPECIES: leucyl aminopeptidase [Gemella]AME09729.1 leucyl aminopeptidase [Gemella sp. oral taxon 928]
MNIEKIKFNTTDKNGVKVTPIFEDKEYNSELLHYTKEKELFSGKLNEIFNNLPYNEEKEILLGLGKFKEITEDEIREVFFKLVKNLLKVKEYEVNIQLPKIDHLTGSFVVKAAVEGSLHAIYNFDKYKSDREELPILTINISTEELINTLEKDIKEAQDIMEAIFFSRDLVNERAEYLYPETLANIVVEKLKPLGVTVEVYDEKQCEELGLKGLLAVGRASARKPRFIVMKYLNNADSDEVTGLVGKGVTYDSGGYSIKPTANSMDIMHCDMGGAGTVIGTMHLIAKRKLKTNVIGIVGACENMISESAYKPGDIIETLSGKTIEVLNTDAEGRITLADSVYYATEKLKVNKVIDLATLTGACLIALGEFYTGAITNNENFFNELKIASLKAGERVWQLPVDDSFRKLNKSSVADVKNTGGRLGGTITAGLFIENFVANDVPWIHLDIAGTAYLSNSEKYLPKGATGVHVKTLFNLLNK